MAQSRKHRTMSAAELQARGASAFSRSAGAGAYAERSAAQQAEDAAQEAAANAAGAPQQNVSYQQAAQYGQAVPQNDPYQQAAQQGAAQQNQAPRTVSAREATDPARYQQMLQERKRSKSPFAKLGSGASNANANYSHANVGHGGGVSGPAGDYLDKVQGALGRAGNAVGGAAGARLQGFGWRQALHWLRNGLLALLAAYVVFVCVVSFKMNLGVDLATRSKLSFAIPGQPYYTLLVGTDKSEERVDAGMDTYRTDSIILARVDPIAGKITLISIQRDTKVDLGEYGTQKINAAYTFGGAPLLIEAVSNLAGVPISNYAEIDLDSFISVVDALGGIEVNVPVDCIDPDYTGANIKAGYQTLDGDNALKLCRARHAYDAYGAGDYYRAANQRMVLGAILKKGLSGNPINLISLIGAVSNSVTCTFLPVNITFLALRFIGFDMSENLSSGLEPTVSSYEDGVWWEVVDEDAWTTMMSRVEQGLSPYADSSEDPTAGVAGTN